MRAAIFAACDGVSSSSSDCNSLSRSRLTAVASAFVYLRIVVSMYFPGEAGATDGLEGPPVRVPWAAGLAIVVAVVGTLAMGIVPEPFAGLTDDATVQIAGLDGDLGVPVAADNP